MTARALMIQGCGSDVGKSLIVAGLCRAALKRGIKVAPFKPQNMSNNAAVAEDGGEIGRAQALQARACGLPASVHMNPVLLKPESDTGAQVVLRGRMTGHAKAREFQTLKPKLLAAVLESFAHLKSRYELVLVEGAGSPAEINLRAGDIANMGFAEAADVPVLLVGDIDRGGVIASLVGTHAVITPDERMRISGFLINKFRGDVSLFADGVTAIKERTDWPCLGVVPWFAEAGRLPAEDAMALDTFAPATAVEGIKIAVPRLSRIANFDDLDPLAQQPGVSVEMVQSGQPLPGDADLVILPGSKSTIGDLAFLREQGWDVDIAGHVRRGGHVLGLCGGYQMLGHRVRDPDGIEGAAGEAEGLGLLDVETVLTPEKAVRLVSGHAVEGGLPVSGYEIHIGRTDGPDRARPFLMLEGTGAEGSVSSDERIAGCYLHGLFTDDGFRRNYLKRFGQGASDGPSYDAGIEATLDALADHLAAHVDLDTLFAMAR